MAKINKREFNLAVIFTLLQVTHVLDFTMMIPLAPIFIREFNLSAAEYSYLVASYNISAGLITLCAGNLIDLMERKKFLLISYVGFIIATMLCALSESFFTLLLSRIVAGAFGGLMTTATFAFLGDQVREEVRGEATGIVLSSFAITSVVGIPLGLHIATIYHWKIVFAFIAAISVFVFFIALKVIPKVAPVRIGSMKILETIKHYKSIVSHRNEFLGLVLTVLVAMSSFIIIPFIAPFLVGNLGLSEEDLKYTYLLGGIFALLSARYVGQLSDKYGNKKIYVICAIMSFIPGLILTHLVSASFGLIMTVSTLFTMMFNSRFIPIMSYMTQIPDKKSRGVYLSIIQSVRTLSVAFATWLAGHFVTISSTGRVEGFGANGWLSTVLILISFYLIKQIKR